MPEHEDGQPRSPVTILMAEDDAGHASLIKRHFREVGIVNDIVHFEDGDKLLQHLESKVVHELEDNPRPYLLLLDIRMPKLSGDEVLAQVREHPKLKLMPVVMLTTTDDPQEVRRCFELGCNDYITKPVEYEQFVAAIKRLGMFLQIVSVPPLRG